MKASAEPHLNSNSSSPPVLSPKERSKPEKAPKIYVIGYIVACLFFDLFAFPFWELCFAGSKIRFIMAATAGMILGCVAGQMGFVSVLAGLGSIRWICGFTRACTMSLVAYATWLGSVIAYTWANPSYIGDDIEPIMWLTCLVPVLLFCLGFPFALLRLATGSYVTSHTTDRARIPFSINDFFITTMVVATLAYLVSSPQFLIEFGDSYWMVAGIVSLALAGLSLFCFLPIFLVSQKIGFASVRVISYLAGAMITLVTLNLILHFTGALTGADVLGMAFTGVFVAAFNYCIGLEAMRASGFRLARIAKGNSVRSGKAAASESSESKPQEEREASPWDESEEEKEQVEQESFWDSQRAAYLCAALVFSIAVTVAAVKFGIELRQRWRLQALNELGAMYLEQGGEIILNDDRIIGAKLGHKGTNRQLQELAKLLTREPAYPQMFQLDLSGSQVDDDAIGTIKEFGNLRRLDLSNTQITDSGVQQLMEECDYLDHLNLSGIALSHTTVVQLFRDRGVFDFLDLSDTGLVIQQISRFPAGWFPDGLGLRNMGLTDKELVEFLESKFIPELDLRNNKLTGEFLAAEPWRYDRLRLGGNPLQDSEIASAANAGARVDILELGEDSLSERCIPDLVEMVHYEISLEDGSFSEAVVIDNAREFYSLITSLNLHGKQYTGRALGAIEHSAKNLLVDMSHSGVTAETLQVVEHSNTETLDLSHTKIDDRAVPVLSIMEVFEMNLSHTALTTEGICEGDWSKVGRLIVAPGQFTFAELEQIRQVVEIDNSNHFSYED